METNNERKENENQNNQNTQNSERENKSPAFDSQHSGDATGGMDPKKDPQPNKENQR